MHRLRLALPFLAFTGGTVPAAVNFNRDIRPVLTENCFHCHGPDPSSRKADLRLDTAAFATRPGKHGTTAIVPGKPDESELLKRLEAASPDDIMPPPDTHKVISPAQQALLRRWIAEGAVYEGHWAFTKPVRPPVPDAAKRHPVDAFITARLAEAGLQAAPPAPRDTLARRAALDLTGLPPEPALLASFRSDASPEAYSRYVDQLLASPHYGERWARVWMDIARYADSAGYGSDPLRLNIWPWRDWVISAFNRNLPWDEFTRLQLAGDLIANAGPEQVVATAFHRNTMTNTEGGTDDEEWRIAAVKDRTAVTVQAWMGLTMGCAQCHSHKFDPISQEEYYRFFAIFNQTEDNDQPGEQPLMAIPTPAEQARMTQLKQEIAALEQQLSATTPELEKEAAAWEEQLRRPVTWEPLDLTASGDSPAAAKQPDGSLLFQPSPAGTATATLTAPSSLRSLTGLRLEMLADTSLPGGGPGHSSGGNGVISEISLSARPTGRAAPETRFIRIEAPGENRFLHLAEVQVFSGETNLAPAGRASQSSTAYGGEARRGNDGNTSGLYTAGSVTHTAQENTPWWEVDLGAAHAVDRITVWNRAESADRLTNWRLVALDSQHREIWHQDVRDAPAPSFTASVDGGRTARFLRATADYSQEQFSVPMAIDGKPNTGWAWGGQTGKNHTAIFELAEPLTLDEAPLNLKIVLAQHYGTGHTAGRLRLSVTGAPPPFDVLPDRLRDIMASAPAARTPEQRAALLNYFRPLSRTFAAATTQLAEKRNALTAIKPVAVPVMKELTGDRKRRSHFLNKGNFLDKGPEVQPGFPAAFGAPPEGTPADRAGVIRWLFSPENPLTARVAVNRFWAQLFGTGIVETEEDFGMQGAYPSHPELLDWLAVEFRETGWDVKRLLKLIVTSDTYCQSSALPPGSAGTAADPLNRLLSRYPRRRLDAEQVRDQALALSGLLSRKIGGPSVYPPQPDGLWKAAFNGERSYQTSTGEDKYRRGLYTIWRRTVPYPSMAAFDAPSRESCTLRRQPTNTPLQAYVTLNDPVYIEAAQSLALRLVREGGTTTGSRLRFGLALVLCRNPDDNSIATLTKLYDTESARYTASMEAAQKLAPARLPEGLTAPEAAAWTAVANVLLNLDGVLTRG